MPANSAPTPTITLYYVRTGYPHCGELYTFHNNLGTMFGPYQADDDPMSNAATDFLWPEHHFHVYSTTQPDERRKPATLEVQK